MYNLKRTLEVFGYDLLMTKRRSKEEVDRMGGRKPKDMPAIDNCPSCNEERQINLSQSRKNKPCSKCFHNTPEMQQIKLAQKGKQLSKEHKQNMKDNHWSRNGGVSPFKGQTHKKSTIQILRNKTINQLSSYSDEEKHLIRMKDSCTKRGIPIEEFNGFSAPEGTRIRQSAEGKAWTYDILAKANFTCIKCGERGGKLHAHHLNGFNSFPEQRFDLNNGACLCESCHDKFHEVYGKGNNTENQFKEWMSE